MHSNDAFFALLLAGRFAFAAYIPLPRQPIEQDADDDSEQIVTEVRVVTEEYAAVWSPQFTYDPLPSYTYDPQPSYTYDPLPSYTYDPPPSYTYDPPMGQTGATEVERLIRRDDSTPPPRDSPSAFRTRPFSSISFTSLLDPNGPPPPKTTGPPNLSSGVSSSASLPDPASPSAFRTKPLSSISITSLLDPDSPPPPNTTGPPNFFSGVSTSASLPDPASPSAFRTRPFSSMSFSTLLDPNGPPPPNTTGPPKSFSGTSSASLPDPDSPSAFRTRPFSSMSFSTLLDPNGPPPPNPTPSPSTSPTKTKLPTAPQNDRISAALEMINISHQDSAPTLLPIQVAPTSTAIALISSVPGAIGPRPLTPTVVNGGTAWVPVDFTRTNLNDAKASSASTTAFQFVSPNAMLSYSAPSEMIALTLTGKGGTEGGWSYYTTTLPTGMATGRVTRGALFESSVFGFVDVGRSSSSGSSAKAKQTANASTINSSEQTTPSSNGSSRVSGTGTTKPPSKTKTAKTASSSGSKTMSENKASTTSKKPTKTSKTPSSTSKTKTTSSTEIKPVVANTTSETASATPAQMIGKGKGKGKKKPQWTGDIRCVYPTPGCDKS